MQKNGSFSVISTLCRNKRKVGITNLAKLERNHYAVESAEYTASVKVRRS